LYIKAPRRQVRASRLQVHPPFHPVAEVDLQDAPGAPAQLSRSITPAPSHAVSSYVSFPRRCMQPSGRQMALIPCHPPRS